MTMVTSINPYPNNNRLKIIDYSSDPRASQSVTKAFLVSQVCGENQVTKVNNLPIVRKMKHKYTLQDIFKEHWAGFYDIYKHRITRPAIVDNIEAFISCRDFGNGYTFYACPNCDNFHMIGFTCKSRFCPSCGKKYSDARAIAISETCINVPHRHMVFTIPEELRVYFRKDRLLIDDLFLAVDQTFKYMATKRWSKKHEYRFGFVSTLHTFGRALNFVPHLHIIIAEGVYDKNNKFKKVDFFSYEQLRKSFQKSLLDLIEKRLGKDEFKKMKNKLYKDNEKGFYVYAPQIQSSSFSDNNKGLIEYVVRYAGHPAMSESRILNVDNKKMLISYYYDPHEDDGVEVESDKLGRQYVTESIYDFMAKLIVHIPDEGKHNIRYYGFYSNRTKVRPFIEKKPLFSKSAIDAMKKLLQWRFRLIKSYGYDILLCECGHIMEIDYDLCYIPNKLERTLEYG